MSGLARSKRMSSVRVTVMSADGKRLKGAKVRLTGVGIRAVVRDDRQPRKRLLQGEAE